MIGLKKRDMKVILKAGAKAKVSLFQNLGQNYKKRLTKL